MANEYTSKRTGIVSSIDIYSFRFTLTETSHYSYRIINTKSSRLFHDERYTIVRLEEPITTTRSVYTPETRPKTLRYCLFSSISLNQRYIFTPVSAYETYNTIVSKIIKRYKNDRNIYYELSNSSLRRILVSLEVYTNKSVHVEIQNYKSSNTVDTFISISKYTERKIYTDSSYVNKRYIIAPTYSITNRKVSLVISKYLSVNDVIIGIAQRFTSTINAITKADNGLFRYAIYEVSEGNTKYSKRLSYWQPEPKHYSHRHIYYKISSYATLNTVLLYEGTKYWQDRYIITDWFIYNSVRYIHMKYKVSNIQFTIGSTNTDILYTKDKVPKCFKFIATTYKVKDINVYNIENTIEKFEKCKSENFTNISKFGIIIPHDENMNMKIKYYLEVFNNEGSLINSNKKIKRYQINVKVKEENSSQRFVDVRI